MQQNMYYNYQDELDEDLNIDLKKVWMILRNRKEIILKVFCSILVFFILVTFIMPKKYKVSADLYINKSNNTNLVDINPYAIEELGAGGAGMAALMSGNSGGLTNEIEIMMSPLIMDRVVRDNGFKIKKKLGIIPNKREGEYVPGYVFAKSKKLSIENKKGTNVVTIEYTAKKPDVAYNVVTSIIKNSMEVRAQLQSDKAKKDTKILENEYDKLKSALDVKMNKASGLPQTALSGTGNITAMSAFSTSAQQALSNIQGQYKTSTRSQITIEEETAKLTQLATKLQWAKMVQDMADSSKVLILKEPQLLRDFEYTSPKLIINVILGIIFGGIASLIAVIFLEISDKKVTYSKLGENIIYNDSDLLFNLQKTLLDNKDKNVSCIIFDNVQSHVAELLNHYKNITILKAELSEMLIDGIDRNDAVLLFASIGKSDAKLYKVIKESIQNKKKPIIKEVLV